MTFQPFELKAQTLDSVKYDYGHLFYQEFGQGKPIIILTGGPGNSSSQLLEVADQLGHQYRSILLEQRGTGRSMPFRCDSVTINLESLIDDLDLLLNHLKLEKAIFLGHSWGGMLALSFAAKYPSKVESLILIGPGPYKSWQQAMQRLRMHVRTRLGEHELARLDLIDKKIAQGSATAVDVIEGNKLFRTAYVYQRPMSDTLFKKIDVARYPCMRQLIWKDLLKNYDLTHTLPNYQGPITVICGRQDLLGDQTYELKLFRPSVEIRWIEKSGHFPMFERPDEFYNILFEILSDAKKR